MIKIIAIGKMKNRSLATLTGEYEKRLSKYDKFQIVELKDSDLQKEGERIMEAIGDTKGKIYALSEEGRSVSSIKFAEILAQDLLSGSSTFVIGGPYGLSCEVKKRADILLSLSPMTFTHEWARAILTEQLYRAKSITAGSGYHHV